MKSYLKYLSWFVGILIIGGIVLWGVQQYRYRHSPEYKVIKYYNDLADQYAKDTYGGDTPEETLRLFIDALKKGDVELASKYFVIEKRGEKLADLKIGKERGNLEKIITFLKNVNYPTKYPDGTTYDLSIVEADNSIKFGVHFILNEVTKKWKIESL